MSCRTLSKVYPPYVRPKSPVKVASLLVRKDSFVFNSCNLLFKAAPPGPPVPKDMSFTLLNLDFFMYSSRANALSALYKPSIEVSVFA